MAAASAAAGGGPMPADNELDPLDRWLNQQVRPLPPPPGTFELITRRARRRKLRRAAVSVASAAAVAAAVAVAVPVGLSLHLTPTPSTGASLAAGALARLASGSPSTLGTGTKVPTPGASGGTASAAAEQHPRRDHSRLPAAQLPALLGDLGLAEHRLDHGARGDTRPLRRAPGLRYLHVGRAHQRRRGRPGTACPPRPSAARKARRASPGCASSTGRTAGRSARSCGRRTTAASTGTR